MKFIHFLSAFALTMLGTGAFAQSKTESFMASGNCGMCKKRIEKAAKLDGVSAGQWDVKSKLITLHFDTTKVSRTAIEQKIAAAGHDTEKVKAVDSVYTKLPSCCLYRDKSKSDHH